MLVELGCTSLFLWILFLSVRLAIVSAVAAAHSGHWMAAVLYSLGALALTLVMVVLAWFTARDAWWAVKRRVVVDVDGPGPLTQPRRAGRWLRACRGRLDRIASRDGVTPLGELGLGARGGGVHDVADTLRTIDALLAALRARDGFVNRRVRRDLEDIREVLAQHDPSCRVRLR